MVTAHCDSVSGLHRLDSQQQTVSVNFPKAPNTFPTGSHRAKQSPSESLSEAGHFEFACLYFSCILALFSVIFLQMEFSGVTHSLGK